MVTYGNLVMKCRLKKCTYVNFATYRCNVSSTLCSQLYVVPFFLWEKNKQILC